MPRKKHYNPEKMIHNRVASLDRSRKREQAKAQFDRRVTKEKAIGVDPIYEHRYLLKYPDWPDTRKEWQKKSAKYDQEIPLT